MDIAGDEDFLYVYEGQETAVLPKPAPQLAIHRARQPMLGNDKRKAR